MPIALLFIAISKFATAATNKKNRQLKLNISEALQEYLENIKVIKSTNQKEIYSTIETNNQGYSTMVYTL